MKKTASTSLFKFSYKMLHYMVQSGSIVLEDFRKNIWSLTPHPLSENIISP